MDEETIYARCCDRAEELHLLVKGVSWVMYVRNRYYGDELNETVCIQVGYCPCCGALLGDKTPTFTVSKD